MKTKIKQAIYSYCKENSDVTYNEIEQIFTANGYHWKGNYSSRSEADENVIFWTGWSKAAFDLIGDMIRNGNLIRNPCDSLLYLIDGKILTLPPVQHPPKDGYKKLHWLPWAFDIGENEL